MYIHTLYTNYKFCGINFVAIIYSRETARPLRPVIRI